MGNSLILASIAADAAPGLRFRELKPLTSNQGGSMTSVMLTTDDGAHYVVRMGASDSAELELATEVAALKMLSKLELPFKVSRLVGETRASGMRPASVFDFVYGNPINLARVNAGSTLAESLGSSIAAIHALNAQAVLEAGFPEFNPADTARARLNELDRLAATGKIAKTLLDRWSEALENVNMFRYTSTVVHSNLNADTILELDGSVSGILAWHGVKVGDPAEDFTFLAANGDQEVMDAVRFAYLAERQTSDANLAQRATLYSEMAMGRWLLHGITTGNQEIIDDGLSMLAGLVQDVETGAAMALIAGTFATNSAGSFIEAEAEPEPVVVQDKHLAFEDTATRQIELPERSEDELF